MKIPFKKICTEEEVAKSDEYGRRVNAGEQLSNEEVQEAIRLQAKCAVDEHLEVVTKIFDNTSLTVDSPDAVPEVANQMHEALQHHPSSRVLVYSALAYLAIEKLREQQTAAVAEEAENA